MLETGTIVGDKYRLEEPIGQGGMATVWRAVHTTLDRPVAVKFLEAVGTQSKQLAARFLQEAKLAAGLRHRHVVDIMDFGVHEEQPFMVMELLEGQSLADRYAEGPPVSDWELMEIVAMTLSGLAAVHDAGILHRDVKPENIFLVEDADGMYPKLLDFGVSRGLGGGGRFTKTGAVVGTPQYMSPEQARGKKDIDQRSDLFSVGSILYEGFSGQVPFDSENPGDVLIMVATEAHAPLDDIRPDLPGELIDVVHRGLEKRPEDRFQTAREMRDALLAVLEGAEQMNGRPPSQVLRTTFASGGTGAGTGKLRVLSVPPGMPEASRSDPSTQVPIRTRTVPDTGELATARLPPPPPTAATPSKRSRGVWVPLLIVLLLGGGAGAFYALDGMRYLDGGPRDPGAMGEVRPGDAVPATLATPLDGPPPPVPIDPPPTDGVPAPGAETVDVPSPPDPPDLAPEAALGAVPGAP